MVSRSVDILVSEFCSRSSLDDYLSRGSLTHSSGLVQSNAFWSFRSNEDPIVQLVYPSGVIKRLLLVVPSNEEDDYRPIEDLMDFCA
ncbi:hypothetical protein BY996DRAFT_6438980 [Phakopsora pachyrhizi]|nr:hypothetical protein BY996DRAFT_6438980 [Phakopsora pachyrhizi]